MVAAVDPFAMGDLGIEMALGERRVRPRSCLCRGTLKRQAPGDKNAACTPIQMMILVSNAPDIAKNRRTRDGREGLTEGGEVAGRQQPASRLYRARMWVRKKGEFNAYCLVSKPHPKIPLARPKINASITLRSSMATCYTIFACCNVAPFHTFIICTNIT